MKKKKKASSSRSGGRSNSRSQDDPFDLGERRIVPTLEGIKEFDYKDQEFLKRFITESGKMVPRRYTGASSFQQNILKKAIRRARNVGLLP